MKYLPNSLSLPVVVLLFLIAGCNSGEQENHVIKETELTEFEVIVSQESNALGIPVIIKHDGKSNFYVYDSSLDQVLKLDRDGNVISEIGMVGRGPGEYSFLTNFFLTENHIYVVDMGQLLAHRYDKEGTYLSSFDFGKKDGRPTTPSFRYNRVAPMEIENKPHITIQDNMLLSTVNVGETKQTIFEILDWDNETLLSEFGDVPEGSVFILDNLKLRNEATDGQVPSFYKANSFPVQDRANPDEFFVVYTALSKIAKYKMSGEKLWEKEVESSETRAIRKWFFESMERMAKSPDVRDRVGLQFYSSGATGNGGDLYLVVSKKPVVIHKFNNTGELVHKYKFISEEVTPVLDFDFSNQRILLATENGEIRGYPF